ncbi:hypothetical protein MNB_SV-13-241 [hydrothermal vent metagenome]|uniref:Peptidase C14 caspase domain-containing protein n=1 Tax=hydrothermal vent metagenome TaxID=652676 RepID=A0A1W1CWK2_9ZZZZ
MKLKTIISTTLLTTLIHAGIAQATPKSSFTPTVEITNNLTSIFPETDVMLEDVGKQNLANYLLPKMKKGDIALDNNINIGFCGEKTYIVTIGINNYKYLPSLTNSISDAEKITNKIENNCQKTRSYTLKNSTKEEIVNKLKSISKKITAKDSLVFYFAGHGVMVNNISYLAPVEAKAKTALQVSRSFVKIDKLTNIVKSIKLKSGLMIFDAQRNRAFKTR